MGYSSLCFMDIITAITEIANIEKLTRKITCTFYYSYIFSRNRVKIRFRALQALFLRRFRKGGICVLQKDRLCRERTQQC